MPHRKVCIVALIYEESYWDKTVKSIESSGLPVVYVDRQGVGSMSHAFNSAISELMKLKEKGDTFDYIWFVTNIEFDLECIAALVGALDSDQKLVGVHPAHNSDHANHRLGQVWSKNKEGIWEVTKCGDDFKGIVEVPFIEWTAPMVRMNYFVNAPLLEYYSYAFFDLLWSYYARNDNKVAVVHSARIKHAYLVQNRQKEVISNIRFQLRAYRNKIELAKIKECFGSNWAHTLTDGFYSEMYI